MKKGSLKELEKRLSSLSLTDEKKDHTCLIDEICSIAEHLKPLEQTEQSKELETKFKVVMVQKITEPLFICELLENLRMKFPCNLSFVSNERNIQSEQVFAIQMQNIQILEKRINIMHFFVYQCVGDANNCQSIEKLKLGLLQQCIIVYSKLHALLLNNQIPVVKPQSYNKNTEERLFYYQDIIEKLLPECFDFISSTIQKKSVLDEDLGFKKELWSAYKEIFGFRIKSLFFYINFSSDDSLSQKLKSKIKKLYAYVIANKNEFIVLFNNNEESLSNETELLKASYAQALLATPIKISRVSFKLYQQLKKLSVELKASCLPIKEREPKFDQAEKVEKAKQEECEKNIELKPLLSAVKLINTLTLEMKSLKKEEANQRAILKNIKSIIESLFFLIKFSNTLYIRIIIPYLISVFQNIDSYFMMLDDSTHKRLIHEQINELKQIAIGLSQSDVFQSLELIYKDLHAYEPGELNEQGKELVARCISYFGQDQKPLFISTFMLYIQMLDLKLPFEEKDATELNAVERSQKYIFLEANIHAIHFMLNHIMPQEDCKSQNNRIWLLNKLSLYTVEALIHLYNSFYSNAFRVGEMQHYVCKVDSLYSVLDKAHNEYCPLMQQHLPEGAFPDIDRRLLKIFSSFILYKVNYLKFLQFLCVKVPCQGALLDSAKINLEFLRKNLELIVKAEFSSLDKGRNDIKKIELFIKDVTKNKKLTVPAKVFYEYLKTYISKLLMNIDIFINRKSDLAQEQKQIVALKNILKVINTATDNVKRIPSGKIISPEQFKRLQDCLMSTSGSLETLTQCCPNLQASLIFPNITILLDAIEKLFMPVAEISIHYKLIIEILNESVQRILALQINLYSEQTIPTLIRLPERVVETPKEVKKYQDDKRIKPYLPEPEIADIPLATSRLAPLPEVKCAPKLNKRNQTYSKPKPKPQNAEAKFQAKQQKKRQEKEDKQKQKREKELEKKVKLLKETEANLERRNLYELQQNVLYMQEVEAARMSLDQTLKEVLASKPLDTGEKYLATLKALIPMLESGQSENRLLEKQLLLQFKIKKKLKEMHDADCAKIRELDALALLAADEEANTQALEQPYKTGFFCEFPKTSEWIEEGVERRIKHLQGEIRKLGFFLYAKGGMVLDGLLTKYLNIPILAHDADCISNVPLEKFLKLAPDSVWVFSHTDFELYRIGKLIQVVIVKPAISNEDFLSEVPGLYSETWQNSYFLNHHGEVLALPGAINHIFNPCLALTRDPATLFEQDVSRIWRLFHLSTKTKKIISETDMACIKFYASGLKTIPFGVYLSRLSSLFLRGRAQLNIELLLREQFVLYLLPVTPVMMNGSFDKSLIDFWIENFQLIDNCDPIERENCYSIYDPIALLLLLVVFNDLSTLVEPSLESLSSVIKWYYDSYPVPVKYYNKLWEELFPKLEKYAGEFYAKEMNKLFLMSQSFRPAFDNYQNGNAQERGERFELSPDANQKPSRNLF